MTTTTTATTSGVSVDGNNTSLVADVFYLRRQRHVVSADDASPTAPGTAPDITVPDSSSPAPDVTPATAPEDTLSVEMAMAAVAAAPSAAVAAVAAAVAATTSPAPAGDAEVSPVASIGGSVDSRDVDNKGTSG